MCSLLPVQSRGIHFFLFSLCLSSLDMTILRHLIKRGGVMLSHTATVNASVLRMAPRRSTVRMMSQEGQIQSELMESMRAKIQTALDAQSVSVSDVQGDGRHVEIVVVSNQFEGQNSVNRQRMVYKAIWEELQDVVHAVRPTDAPLVASHVLSVTPRPHHSPPTSPPLTPPSPPTSPPLTSLPAHTSSGRLDGLQDPQRIVASIIQSITYNKLVPIIPI